MQFCDILTFEIWIKRNYLVLLHKIAKVLIFIWYMEKQEAKELIKVLGTLEKTISSQTKEYMQFNRKMDTFNESINRLTDKIGTYIQLVQNK